MALTRATTRSRRRRKVSRQSDRKSCGPSKAATAPAWLTEEERAKYRALWQRGLHGACNYYRATPLVPPRAGDPGAEAVQMPEHLCTIPVPTRVLWGADDFALLPGLLDGLEAWIPRLAIRRIAGASHWLVHEQPERVTAELAQFLQEKL